MNIFQTAYDIEADLNTVNIIAITSILNINILSTIEAFNKAANTSIKRQNNIRTTPSLTVFNNIVILGTMHTSFIT